LVAASRAVSFAVEATRAVSDPSVAAVQKPNRTSVGVAAAADVDELTRICVIVSVLVAVK
jgi:hypothetical protein